MDKHTELLNWIRQSPSPLLQPQALHHSQELGENLPPVRRYVGPRAWYQCLEEGMAPPGSDPRSRERPAR